jgi:hypothetical protein
MTVLAVGAMLPSIARAADWAADVREQAAQFVGNESNVRVLHLDYLFDGGSVIITLGGADRRTLGLLLRNATVSTFRGGNPMELFELRKHIISEVQLSKAQTSVLRSRLSTLLAASPFSRGSDEMATARNTRILLAVLRSPSPPYGNAADGWVRVP